MTDRADEIAIRWSSEATSKMADQIRAYALEFAKGQYKQGRNAALEEVCAICPDCKGTGLVMPPQKPIASTTSTLPSPALCGRCADTRALREKP